jgi:hypothetical protein
MITISLPLAKRLKDLGVNKGSLFYYRWDYETSNYQLTLDSGKGVLLLKHSDDRAVISSFNDFCLGGLNYDLHAYTRDEMLDILPETIFYNGHTFRIDITRIDGITHSSYGLHSCFAKSTVYPPSRGRHYNKAYIKHASPAEASGLMLEWLIINGYVKVEGE